MRPFDHPKELLPIGYQWLNGCAIVPSLVIEHSIAAIGRAGIHRSIVIISPAKSEIVRVLGQAPIAGVQLGFVVQPQPAGLPDAILQAYPFIAAAGCNACLALPDTIFEPTDAIQQIVEELARSRADLVLGVFPTHVPEQLAPVLIRADRSVSHVFDKPTTTTLRNTWGIAAWTPRFFDLLAREASVSGSQCVLSDVFNTAISKGLSVVAVEFTHGKYRDLGTPGGITELFADLQHPYEGTSLACDMSVGAATPLVQPALAVPPGEA